MNNIIIRCENLSKSYHDGQTSVNVLQNLNFDIHESARIAIVGPSGSGKSTLLHLLGGLDDPTQGHVYLQGIDWQTVSETRRCQLRCQNLGFIYQFHHLLPEFSARENVAMPLLMAGMRVAPALKEATEILQRVGLSERLQHKPSQLSGGERQRVAIARALVPKPRCVFADEPTGNLDQSTAQVILDMMLALNQTSHTALVIVTHDQDIAQRMDHIFTLKDGQLKPKKSS